MNKCLALFVEGDTELEFYRQLIANARSLHPKKRFDTKIEYVNVNGFGGFKNTVLRKFLKQIKPKYDKTCEFTIVLCYDTDVFDFAHNPPINWSEVKKELENKDATVIFVKAKHSIEDWFLLDFEGILKFLRLPKNTKTSGKNGFEKLQNLYKKANNVYYKGMNSNNMISHLDIKKIANLVKDQLIPLYTALGVDTSSYSI